MSAASDGDLLQQYARTRSDADFRPLVVRYAPLVHNACRRRLRRDDLAEDATQTVFILLAEKAGQIRVGNTLAPWLLKAARLICLRIARSEGRRRESPLIEEIPAHEDPVELSIVAALQNLRGDERDAIVLRFVHGLSLVEVGEQLGVSEDAARMRVQRGLARLRKKLTPLATLPASFIDRLATPSRVSASQRQLALPRNPTMSGNVLIVVPIGISVALFAIGFQSKSNLPDSSEPQVPTRTNAGQTPSTGKKGVAAKVDPMHLHLEEYLGKNVDWFAANIGKADGATSIGGGRAIGESPLEWKTYNRRSDLGGGLGRTAVARYTLGAPEDGKVLSVSFDGPIDSEPVATHVGHGIEFGVHRTLAQEAAYVGVNMGDYRRIPDDASYPEGTMLYRKRADAAILMVVTHLNDTWQIELSIDYFVR